jgi:hypothetical protein
MLPDDVARTTGCFVYFRGDSPSYLFLSTIPTKAGIQGDRSAAALAPRFRGMTVKGGVREKNPA